MILLQVPQVPQQVSQVPQQVQPATQHTQFVYSNSQSPQQDLLQSQQPSPGAQQAQQQSQQQPITPPCQQQQLQQQQLQPQPQVSQVPQVAQQVSQVPQQVQQQQQQSQQPSNQQQQQQQQQLSKPPESSCSLGIDNSGTDSATISIKLPPSVLQDQKQLSNIVNTISKALHQPASTDTCTKNEVAANSTNVGDQQPPHVQPLTPPPQPFALKPPEAPSTATQNWSTAPSVVPTDIPNTNWLDTSDADDGFEQKRQKVSDNFVTNPEGGGVVAPGVGVGVPNENAVDSWTAQASQLAKPAWEQQSVVSTAPQVVAPESVSGPASVVSWVTSSTVQDNSIASVTNWNQTVQTIAKISDSSVAPSIVPSAVTNGWNFSEKVENSVTSSVNLTAGINDASNDSGKCTKWENINAKPLDQPWSNANPSTNSILTSEDTSAIPVRNMTAPGVVAGNPPVNTFIANAEQTLQWVNKSEAKNSTWTTGSEAAVSSISESYTVSADTTWSNAEQVMDSTVGVGLSNAAGVVVSAEMIPVNPKEVSPMDVDDILNRVPPSTSANNMIHQNTSALFVPASTLIETAVVTSLTPSVIAASTVQLAISPQNIISTTFPSCQ